MFSLQLPSLFGSKASQKRDERPIDLSSVAIHHVETAADKRPRTLKHLLKANHANYSIIYHNLSFHNHTPHILGSAYILGATHEHLNHMYEVETEHLEPWVDAPGEISPDDWRDFLGKKEYQRAFIDFFEDQLVAKKYDWRALLGEYMFVGERPLINSVVSGLAHPIIHLGYAYELDSKTVAIEALAMTSCFYDFIHKYVEEPRYTRQSQRPSTSLLEILGRVKEDKRFDGLYEHRTRTGDISRLFEQREEALLEYWNEWELPEPKKQFEESQQTAVAVLMASDLPAKSHYDFFLCHLLTSSHAVRILLPLIPKAHHLSLVRQWWLFTLAVYIAQTRPTIDLERITAFDLQGRDWNYVSHQALESAHQFDAHYVKALRAMKEAAETWGDEEGFYLRAAVKLASEFEQWG